MAAPGQTTAAAATGNQFYVTHCVTADSVLNSPGFSVRAASAVNDPEELRLALAYPPYELPIDSWKDKPKPPQTPRRLARSQHPGNGIWVVHSVYLEKDTMGRDRSYFSHLLHLPATVDAAAVLESWDAPGWTREYPSGATKALPKAKLPAGKAISAEVLTAFLSARPAAGPADVAATVCPGWLREKPAAARRDLVGRFLHALMLATESENPERDRLFVHAEPGLVALLIYAAARILPPPWTADLTFTTFEPYHRSLRDFDLADVVGTYFGVEGKALDSDLVTARGFGLDAVTPNKSSPELNRPLPPGVGELIDLAAGGEWVLLGEVHRLLGTEIDRAALTKVGGAIALARAVDALNRGEPTNDHLLTLRASPRGAAVLTQRADKVWPIVRDSALADARIRTAFADWIAEPARLDEYRKDAARALARGDYEGWDSRWAVVREAGAGGQAKAQLEKAMKNLDEHLPNLPVVARDRLRAACAETGLWPDHHLLAPRSPDEFDQLLAARTPAEWQGYSCFAVMGPDDKNWLAPATAPFRPAMPDKARRHLLAAPSAVLRGYLSQVKPFTAAHPEFLQFLLARPNPEFLTRLIDAGAEIIEPEDWVKLLGELEVHTAPQWDRLLLKHDNLSKLLGGFKADPAATPLWDIYLDWMNTDLLDGAELDLAVFDQLKKAKIKLTGANVPLKSVLPAGGPAKLNAADTLMTVMADPASAERLESGELVKAFQAFGVDPVEGLKKVYYRYRFHELHLPAEAARLDPFIAVFQACYPVGAEFYTIRTAVARWLALSEACPAQTRAAFQAYFVQKCVHPDWHRGVLEDTRQVQFLPEAEAEIREWIAAADARRRVAAEKYHKPAAARSGGGGEDDEGYASPATKRAKSSKPARRTYNRRGRGSGGVSLIVWVFGLLLLIGGGVAVYFATKDKGGGKPPASEPAADPAKDKKDDKKGTKDDKDKKK